ncbi:hypothetical protein [Flavobacterium sp.]|jgi:hypothetical protein|uniref:hypothetical protein n=1 Tax=Flavobacterium sp. TaxID=239 RepID=UPI0037BF0ECE
MNKEEFIKSVLNSTNGMTQAVPSEDLYLRIEHKINDEKVISIHTLWMVAASIALLIGLNIILLNSFPSSNSSEMSRLEQTINPTNQLYTEL